MCIHEGYRGYRGHSEILNPRPGPSPSDAGRLDHGVGQGHAEVEWAP